MSPAHGHPEGLSKKSEKYGQPSRKGKKAWRKNVDLREVEKGLQDLDNEIIRGGVIREKASSDLFTIDVRPDQKTAKRLNKGGEKRLKSSEIIAQRSAVPAIHARKRPSEKAIDVHKSSRTEWIPHTALARLRLIADGHHEALIARDAKYDIWDASSKPQCRKSLDFLPEVQPPLVPKSMKQRPISLTASGKHAPAVQNPSGGYSYNPAFADYEHRLNEELAKAAETDKKRMAAESAERRKHEAISRSAAEAAAAEERTNLCEWEEDTEWEGFQSCPEDERPKIKQPKRKTQAQRNRIKRRKEEERLAKIKATMKERWVQEQRIGAIAKELEERERQQALVETHQASSSDETDNEMLRRRQLGKFKLQEKDLELVLPDELQESLRLLKPEGNLLKDRYRSMLVRGKMESRRHIPYKRQAKRKYAEIWSHKDFAL